MKVSEWYLDYCPSYHLPLFLRRMVGCQRLQTGQYGEVMCFPDFSNVRGFGTSSG